MQNGPQLTDAIFKSIARFPHLHSLEVSGCPQLTGEEFVRLYNSGSFKAIENFEAVGSPKLSGSRAFMSALVRLPQLRLLRLDNPESGLIPLLTSATKLESLHFERIAGRTMHDSGFKAVASLTNLKSLELSSLEGVADYNFGLLKRLTGLQTLALRNAPAMRASSLAQLGENRKLRSLDLSDCPNLGDDGIICIISQFPALEHLCLAGTGVTDHALFLLGHSRTPQLTRLSLARCAKLTKDGLAHVPSLGSVRDLRLENTVLRKQDVLEFKRRFPNKNMRVTVSADAADVAKVAAGTPDKAQT